MKAFIKFMSVALLLFSTLVNADSNEEDYLLDTGDTISVQVYGASWLWQRPIVLATLGLTLAFLAAMVLRGRRDRAMRAQQAGGGNPGGNR